MLIYYPCHSVNVNLKKVTLFCCLLCRAVTPLQGIAGIMVRMLRCYLKLNSIPGENLLGDIIDQGVITACIKKRQKRLRQVSVVAIK